MLIYITGLFNTVLQISVSIVYNMFIKLHASNNTNTQIKCDMFIKLHASNTNNTKTQMKCGMFGLRIHA